MDELTVERTVLTEDGLLLNAVVEDVNVFDADNVSAADEITLEHSELTTFSAEEALRNEESVEKKLAVNLDRNLVTQWPMTLLEPRFRWIRVVYLGQNKLERIPEQVSQLSRLEHLYLHDNRLRGLPTSMTQLTQLRVLTLQGNPLSGCIAMDYRVSSGKYG